MSVRVAIIKYSTEILLLTSSLIFGKKISIKKILTPTFVFLMINTKTKIINNKMYVPFIHSFNHIGYDYLIN
jgi:hypothetical protein